MILRCSFSHSRNNFGKSIYSYALEIMAAIHAKVDILLTGDKDFLES